MSRDTALAGRTQAIPVAARHAVLDAPLQEPAPGAFAAQGLQRAVFGLGCFWGAERRFWQCPGVYTTAVGYAGGYTPNPHYDEVCSGQTAHAEVVQVVYDPARVSYRQLLALFFESHDPTQGMRQGNDVGSQYRSVILTTCPEQVQQAQASLDDYQQALEKAGLGAITTEIAPLEHFYYAEDYHQQYLAKNPNGYCGLGGTGIDYPDSATAG